MFRWADYYDLAEELIKRMGDEAAERSAVSRAYYAAFGSARGYLIRQGVVVPKAGPAHRIAWERFHAVRRAEEVAVGSARTHRDPTGAVIPPGASSFDCRIGWFRIPGRSAHRMPVTRGCRAGRGALPVPCDAGSRSPASAF